MTSVMVITWQAADRLSLAKLTIRVHPIFPETKVKVKPLQANALNSDTCKSSGEKLNRMPEEMFKEFNICLISEYPLPVRLTYNISRPSCISDCLLISVIGSRGTFYKACTQLHHKLLPPVFC